jgi:hypothetical protein
MLHFCRLVNTAAMALRYLPEVQQHLPLFQSGSTCGGIHSEKIKGRKSQFSNLTEIFSESTGKTKKELRQFTQ